MDHQQVDNRPRLDAFQQRQEHLALEVQAAPIFDRHSSTATPPMQYASIAET